MEVCRVLCGEVQAGVGFGAFEGRWVVASLVESVAELRLALAIEAAQLGSWIWDMASGTTTWDARLEEMHGLPLGGFGGTFDDWVAALHPLDRSECIALVEAALVNPGPVSPRASDDLG